MRNKEAEYLVAGVLGNLLRLRTLKITYDDYNIIFNLILEYLKDIPIAPRELNNDWKDIINESNKRFNQTAH